MPLTIQQERLLTKLREESARLGRKLRMLGRELYEIEAREAWFRRRIERVEAMRDMRKNGRSCAAIGRSYGISRQAVHKMLQDYVD